MGVFHEKAGGSQLSYGAGFLAKRGTWPGSLVSIRQALVEKHGDAEDNQEWWLYQCTSAVKPRSDDFYQLAAENASAFAQQFADLILEILEQQGDRLLAADRDLSEPSAG
jgi:hypothetical protein